MERERRKIPVEVDDDGFSIDESRLTESIKDSLDELKEHASDHKEIPTTRLLIGTAIAFCIMLAIVTLAFRGAIVGIILAGILAVVALIEMGTLLNWIEGKK